MLALKKGDIVAVHGTGFIPRAIELITHSNFHHVAIVADPSHHLLIEANGYREVGYQPLDAYNGAATVYRVDDLTDAQREGIVRFAREQFGKPYDYKEILDQFERYVLGVQYDDPEDGRFICSTLIEAAYLSVGVKLTDFPLPAPAEIAKSKLTRLVGRY